MDGDHSKTAFEELSCKETSLSAGGQSPEQKLSIPFENFYSEEEMNKYLEFSKRIQTNTYDKVEEICRDVDIFMRISKYNLKRNYGEKNTSQPSITFVCSCISKKKMKRKKQNNNKVMNGEPAIGQTETTTMMCLSEILKKERQNSTDLNFKKRTVKRTNAEACKFRMKFSLRRMEDHTYTYYQMNQSSYLEHNHPPGNGEQILSSEDFSYKSRNIKFNLKNINYIIYKICKQITKTKIMDTEFIAKIRQNLWGKIHPKDPEEERMKTTSDCKIKKFRNNFLKKLTYFIKALILDVLSVKNVDALPKWKIYLLLYRLVLKKGANYLMQDSLYILKSEINSIKFEKNNNNLEEYISNHLIEYRETLDK